MNKQEAKNILQGHLRPYKKWDYKNLKELIGGEHVTKIIGQSGTEYFFEIYVNLVNECDVTLEVEGMVTEVEGRRYCPPTVHGSFCIAPDSSIGYESTAV